jgi:predicted transglutaminase-like cysteine proteinase
MAWSARVWVLVAWLPLAWACAGASAQQPDGGMLHLLRQVNETTNRRYVQVEELANRWSAPDELRASGQGDCEDFAIAKYFALLEAAFRRGACASAMRWCSWAVVTSGGRTWCSPTWAAMKTPPRSRSSSTA